MPHTGRAPHGALPAACGRVRAEVPLLFSTRSTRIVPPRSLTRLCTLAPQQPLYPNCPAAR
eukprot:9129316-Pyramimonas_sp.AAC.1